MSASATSVGLFAGIGGIELGLEAAGFGTELLCEIDLGAQSVLKAHFEGAELHDDVTTLKSLPAKCDVLSGGFPCQDLSQAGRGAGITGRRSGLVDQVFRLLDKPGQDPPTWLLLENVPFMLQLDGGEAMRFLAVELGRRGFRWAYRVVDARAFGIPQRRRRVLLLASKTEDPRPVLFGQDVAAPSERSPDGQACGFYWTEGNTGLGWAVDAVPTIKGGSGLGIPSPPAIWMPDGAIVTPDIRDAERLQGFRPDWTLPAVEDAELKKGARWKLVGNAVCAPMSQWLAGRLTGESPTQDWGPSAALRVGERWPTAAWGEQAEAFEVPVGEYPVLMERQHLSDFLEYETHPLSERAVRGFRNRLAASSLKHPEAFMTALNSALEHHEHRRKTAAV